MDIFSCFCMWNSCPKFLRTFHLHYVEKGTKVSSFRKLQKDILSLFF
jgi:hypothetical protein